MAYKNTFFLAARWLSRLIVNCSGVLVAEMDATRSVDNDSGIEHKKRASQSDFIHVYMKFYDSQEFTKKSAPKISIK